MIYDSSFYADLNKPNFQPPSWIFAPVWSILYILMFISVFIVAKHTPAYLKPAAISVFLVQLMLNLVWSPMFFVHHKIKNALFICISLTVCVAFMIVLFSKISLIAAILQIPYLLWLIFATILNASIVKLNPKIN